MSTKEMRRAVVAFSNTNGGVVVVGARDDGRVTGFLLTSRSSAKLNNDVLGVVVNPGRYQVHPVTVDDKSIVIISIASREEGFAQLPDGSVLGRFGTSNCRRWRPGLARVW